ncbi:MAG: hypothetical protein WCD69_20040, partial [Xanthobacteraceae bacterium]
SSVFRNAITHAINSRSYRERIAKRIMKAAYDGVIDREQLRQLGLFGFRKLEQRSQSRSCFSLRHSSREHVLGGDEERKLHHLSISQHSRIQT